MKSRTHNAWRLISVVVGCGAFVVAAISSMTTPLGAVRAVAQEAPADGDYEALAQGAVHEAFAEPIAYDPEPGEVVAKEPPAPIEELPPETQPEGDNVVWIPGYWNWDEDREDFVWLSGFWRDVPPGREWVPGYWTKAMEGWQWVAGYWASAEEEEVDYLPNPPATLEVGPATPAPSTDHIWVPGCWMWRDVRYAWRPGYWVVARPNWVWVPAHYVWTPGGFVFVNGYWDMPVARRGILFAPVYFRSPIYARPAYRYSPTVVVNLSLFTTHLWVRPSWGCYYFGDYYAVRYSNRGFYPWHSFHSGRHGYDPIFVQNYHQHVHIEKNQNWANNLKRDYTRHVEHVETRPARSFSTLAVAGAAGAAGGASLKNMGMVTTLKQASTANDLPMKFHKIDEGKRQEFAKQSKETHTFTKEREKLEKVAGEGRPIPTRKGRPDRTVEAGNVAKGTLPKLDAPKVAGGKDGGEKPAADSTVRKVGRPRSPLGDKSENTTVTKKREVPPRLDQPGAGVPVTGAKTTTPKLDQPGRDKTGGGLGKKRDDDDKPNTPPGLDKPKGKPRDLPRVETPKGTPKFDPPKTTPKIDPPRTTPKVDPPRTKPKTETPRTTPKTESPRTAPKVDPPRTAPKSTPRTEVPRTTPSPKPRSETPSNPPPRTKGKGDKKDRNASAGLFDGNSDSPVRPAARTVDSQPAPRIVRSEPRAESRPRAESTPARPTANDNRVGNRNDNSGNGNGNTSGNDRSDDRRRDRRRP